VFFRPPLSQYVTGRLRPDRNKDSVAYGIRVDPDHTFLYYQNFHEIHGKIAGEPKMKLSDYMNHIADPQLQKTFPKALEFEIPEEIYYDEDSADIYTFTSIDTKFLEIRVRVDQIPNDWLVNPPKLIHPLSRAKVESIAGPRKRTP
jgi:hypothetical protein